MARVMIGLTVTDRVGYVWEECLDAVAHLDNPEDVAHAHCVLHEATQCRPAWEAFCGQAQFPFSDEEYGALPARGRSGGHGYNDTALVTVMYLQERLRKRFLATDCSHLLFVECDQLLRPSTLRRLLADDRHIVMGVTPARHAPDKLNACAGKGKAVSLIPLWGLPLAGLLRVTTTGLGCTLVQRAVLEQVGWPDPPALMREFGNGGDVTLGVQAAQCGFSVWVDLDAPVTHVQLERGERLYMDVAGQNVVITSERGADQCARDVGETQLGTEVSR